MSDTSQVPQPDNEPESDDNYIPPDPGIEWQKRGADPPDLKLSTIIR